jgi:Tfp pilus assembly protein PilE
VVVAIIAILAAIALPAYSDYVLRGRLVDATSALGAQRATLNVDPLFPGTALGRLRHLPTRVLGHCNTQHSARLPNKRTRVRFARLHVTSSRDVTSTRTTRP